MNAPSRADKPSSFLLGIVTVMTRLRRARYGKSRPVHEERRVGALAIMHIVDPVIQAAAPSFGVELRAVGVRDAGEIERAITAFARSSNGGLIVTGSPLALVHRDLIITLAARHRLPAVYPFSYFATSGGLLSYGPNTTDPYRRAASYVDRILKGEMPADLPVQAPTKYELVVNLKTAKALGLTVPQSVLLRADHVIE